MRVLVVEDERKVADALKEGLQAEEYDVAVERTGEGAFFRTATETFDLILLDLIMPKMSGDDAYRMLREISHSIPIVICSGFSDEEFKIGIEGDEFAAVVNKPYKPDQLQHMLMKLLDKTG